MRSRVGATSSRTAPVALVALCVLLGGCVSVPTSGPVEQVAPRGAGEDFLVQITPSRPAAGATRLEIVRGFLTAMQAFPVSTEVAHAFLTDEAADGWQPGRRTVVYANASVSEGTGTSVDLRTRAVAVLSSRGSYRPVGAAGQRDTEVRVRALRLERTAEGWRIADPPDQLMLSTGFFEEYFRPYDLYFFDPGGSALVAAPVWFPLGEQLSTRLVQGLLAGPTPWLGGEAVTAVTSAAGVEVSVPLGSDGVADVRLGEAAAGLSASQLRLLSIQVVWTLWQVAGVEGVRLSVDGAPLDVPGVGAVQTTDSWEGYHPSGPTSRTQLYGVRRGRLVVIGGETVAPVAGWWGSKQAAIGEFSVQRTLRRVAATDPARDRLLVGRYDAQRSRQVRTWYTADGTLQDPQWDRTGQLWALDNAGGSSTLVVALDGRWREIPAGGLAGARFRSLAVSPDGARVAALVDRWPGPYRGGASPGGASSGGGRGAVLVVARVVRDADGSTVRRLDQAYAVPLGDSGLHDLAAPVWGAPSVVSVLGRVADVPTQEYRVSIDGSTIEGAALTGEPLLGPVGATDLAASGVAGAATVIGDRQGRMWTLDLRSEWSRLGLVDGVRHPRYPD